jgi:hypothetical protein
MRRALRHALAAITIAAVSVFGAVTPVAAAPPTAPTSASRSLTTVQNWTVTEIALTSTRSYANPFLDVEVTATFIGPSGQVITRPGYWDGGSTWRVRFAPTALGTWKYFIESSDSRNLGLLKTGVLKSVAYTGDDEIYQRGFLTTGATSLDYADGSPFFWLGDTHWFFDRKEAWGPVGEYDSQFTAIVDKRVDQKFTVYQSVIFGDDGRYWAEGQKGTTINPAYFSAELDRKMAYIAQSGLVNAFGVGFHSNIDDFELGEQRLAQYIVARYGAYPMVWMTSGEGAGYDVGTREARIDGWRSVAQAIHEVDSYDHPQTAHSPAVTEKATLGLPHFYEGEGWFDFEMVQGGHQKFVPAGDYDFYRQQYGLPFLESEANYEQIYDGYATDTIVRQTAYRSIQAGGFGYGYGAHGIWNATRDDSDTADDYGYGHRNWDDALDFVGADQMTHLIDFYRSIPLQTMTYRADAATWSGTFVAGATEPVVRADDAANTVTVYFSAGTSSVGALTQLADAAYTARWFDPRTGASTGLGAIAPAGGAWSVPEKPTAEDWLLVVTRDAPAAVTPATSIPLTDVSAGKPITRFGGTIPKGQTVDLGAAYELSEIAVAFPSLLARNQYVLEGSLDGTTWFALADRTGAPVYGTRQTERVSGTARYVRLTLQGLSRLATLASPSSARSVSVTVLAKVGIYATLRSTAFLVDEAEPSIGKVTVGIDRAEFLSKLTPTTNATLSLWSPDGTTEVTEGAIAEGMRVTVTSQDGQRTRTYVVRTVFDNGENIARSATATASSVESAFYTAASVNDGNNSTESWSGWAAIEFPAWVELDFGEERTFNRVDVFTKLYYEQKGFSLQYWDGDAWVDVVTVTDNTADHRAHVFEAVTASKLRLWTTQGNVRQDGGAEKVARVNEIEVYYSNSTLVESIGITGGAAIETPGGTLQLAADVAPATASDRTVVWSVSDPGGGPTFAAAIDGAGMLTAIRNGTVRVTAAALDGSAVLGTLDVTITGQEETDSELISLGKPVVASSVNGPASAATDGDPGTVWVASGPDFPQWIVVDLGSEHRIDTITQLFNNEDEWKYEIAGSLDATNWTTWVDESGNTSNRTEVTHQIDGTARWVRLLVVGAKSVWPNWASSKEFSIFGAELNAFTSTG